MNKLALTPEVSEQLMALATQFPGPPPPRTTPAMDIEKPIGGPAFDTMPKLP